MKKLLMITTIAVILASCAKEKVATDDSSSAVTSASRSGGEDRVGTPPQAVLTSFVAKFGNVPVRQWKLRSDGTWRAHFTKNGVPWEATFKADGTLVKSERA